MNKRIKNNKRPRNLERNMGEARVNYQSKGPARKITLLKELTLAKMKDGENINLHLNQFFDAVDKLQEMDLTINDDLLANMVLFSLPSSFENFRCASESRDELPSPEVLKIKIKEESEAKKCKSTELHEDAMFIRRFKTCKMMKVLLVRCG